MVGITSISHSEYNTKRQEFISKVKSYFWLYPQIVIYHLIGIQVIFPLECCTFLFSGFGASIVKNLIFMKVRDVKCLLFGRTRVKKLNK